MVLSVEAADNNSILASGDLLGCYRIEGFLGRGGFGVTYLALDTILDLQVAIKEYLPKQIAKRTLDNSVQPISSKESSTFSWGLSNFIKEAQTLAKFKHPSIVRVMAVFEQNGTAYMVMEYERGQELKDLIHTKEICNEVGLKRIIGPVIDGLAVVHRDGYIHRDIKPANILIRQDGSPVLLDFGSARLATGVHTKSLTALVTAGYAPLEQYSHSHDSQQGPWTDVYALAGVLYFAISGKVPVDSTLRGSAVFNEQQDPLNSLEMLAPDGFSVAFCRAIDWALSFRIKDRPQTLLEWRVQLLKEAAPAKGETMAMPSMFAQPVNQNFLPASHQTASNEITDSHPYNRPKAKYSPPSVNSAPNPTPAAPGIPTKSVAEFNKRKIQKKSVQTNKKTSTTVIPTERLPSDTRSKKALIIELSFIGLTVSAVLLQSHWLPAVQRFFANDSKVVAERSTLPRTTIQPAIFPNLKQAEGAEQAASEMEQVEAAEREAAEKRRLEEQAKARNKQLDALRTADEQEAVRRAEQKTEQNERIERLRALAKTKREAQLEEAVKADRLAEEKVKRDKEEAARIAKQGKDEAARIAEEKAKQGKDEAARVAEEKAKQGKDEAARVAEEKAKQGKEEAAKRAQVAAQLEARRIADEQARILAEEAEQRLANQEATQQSLEAAAPINDTDIGIVSLKFKSLRDAIVNKDESALVALTFSSPRKKSYFDYLFETFETIEVSLDDVSASPGDQTVRANLRLIQMNRANGDVVIPPLEFETIPIYSVRSGEWSKIYW